MSRIFLFSANVTTDPFPVYPLGMAVIASALVARGHQVRQFDYLVADRSEQRLNEELSAFAPDYVCFSLRNIDNVDSFNSENHWYLAQAREQIRSIRRSTAAPIILGGAAFSIMPEEILTYLEADYGISGEGEAAVCDLVETLAQGAGAARITRGQTPLAGAQMMAPLLEQELVDFYMAQSGMINLQTKRGCPYGCSYCTYPSLEGNRFRPRDPGMVVDDLARAAGDHGVKSFFFTDSIFNDPQGHYLQLAEEILRRGLDIRWCAFFRPQSLGRRELALLKRAGLYAVELGTDAASDTTLDAMHKGFRFEEVFEVNRACLEEELPCAHYIIFGGPGETPQTVEQGLVNIEELGKSVVFAFSGIRILSGTKLHAQAVREGVICADTPLLKPVYYYSPGIDPRQMNERIEASFRNRRNRIFPPSAGQEKMAVMQRFGYRGILWDKLVSFGPKKGGNI